MNIAQVQYFPLTELRNRANMANENIKAIKIYNGDNGKKGGLAFEVRRTTSGEWPDAQFDYFESRMNGLFTAILWPGNETIYLESATNSGKSYGIEYDYSTPGHVQRFSGFKADQFIQRILELERENDKLKEDVKDLEGDLEQFSTASGKLEHTFVNIFTNHLLPFFNGNNTVNVPMQGTQQQQQQQPTQHNMNWQQKQIIVQGDDDETLNNAIDVLVEAFGEANIVRIAQKLQQQPSLVNTLTAML